MILRYEEVFAKAIGVPYAAAFWKGRVALYAILRTLGICRGNEVIMPGFTCVAVPNAVRFAGGTPIYADITPGSYNLDPASVESVITSRTRALIIQHTFGIPADLDSLLEIARRHRLAVIEDCAHSIGTTYRGKLVGTFGTAAFFSSQWSKPYTTGLGGIAVTCDAEIAVRLKKVQADFVDPPIAQQLKLKLQHALYQTIFSPRSYWLAYKTLNILSQWNLFVGSSGDGELKGAIPNDLTWKMSSLQARIGVKKVENLSQNLAHRRRLVEFYEKFLESEGWQPIAPPKHSEVVYLRYPICVENKWELLERAAESRIELGGWFESVLHPVRASLERFGYRPGTCPVAERTARKVVNLPLHNRVSLEEAERTLEFISAEAQRSPRIASSVLGRVECVQEQES